MVAALAAATAAGLAGPRAAGCSPAVPPVAHRACTGSRLAGRLGDPLAAGAGAALAAVALRSYVGQAQTRPPKKRPSGGPSVASMLLTVASERGVQPFRNGRPVVVPEIRPLTLGDDVGATKADAATEPDDTGAEETAAFLIAEDTDSRLDVVLAERYTKSRNYFQALIDRGAVRVNGQEKPKSFMQLKQGDEVSVRFLIDEATLPLSPEPIPLEVLHEDADVLVINKPAGLVVHPGPGHWSGTLVNAVMHHVGGAAAMPKAPDGPGGEMRPGVVHRLDMGTTGVIVVAKTTDAFADVSRQFAERQVEKTYIAIGGGRRQILRGHRRGGGHVVDLPLGRVPGQGLRVGVLPESQGGRSALSTVRCLAEDARFSLLEVYPRTGRTHQIRVHLAQIQTPVLGDATYGSTFLNKRWAKGIERPLLHAHRLVFSHPRTRERMEFVAPLPEDICWATQGMVPLEIAGEPGYVEKTYGLRLGERRAAGGPDTGVMRHAPGPHLRGGAARPP